MRTNIIVIIFLVLFTVAGCTVKKGPEEADIAQKIVFDYYTALNNKDYQTMYGLISNGFKQIEPTAMTYEAFALYMAQFFNTAKKIHVMNTKINSASSTEVVIDYVAVIELKSGQSKELKSTFTVKKKPEGWRLIHPYGQNIDTS